jgi:hypothetical protein
MIAVLLQYLVPSPSYPVHNPHASWRDSLAAIERATIIYPPTGGARSSPDRALAPLFRRQQTARRSLKEDMLEKAMDILMLLKQIWV